MNLFETIRRFPEQKSCIDYIESIRFRNGAYCPLCGSIEKARRSNLKSRVGRWNCHDCKSSFNVLSGTIMQGTHIPLQKWFVAIALVVNAKKSLSSYQLGRDLELNQKSAWYMQQRIRAAMASDQSELLTGIIEADETYVGSKPRKANKKNQKPHKRGRGSDKTPVIGAVKRDGKVRALVAGETGKGVLNFVQNNVRPDATIMITDENQVCRTIRELMPHDVVNHKVEYVHGPFHTNTIEGFWSLLKRAWHSCHHKYAVKFMPLFVAEAAWKYNHRHEARPWDAFMESVFA